MFNCSDIIGTIEYSNIGTFKYKKMQKITLYIIAGLIMSMTACQPFVEDKIDIGLPPAADFSIEYIDANNVRLTNTTGDDNFIASWDLGDLGVQNGNIIEATYLNMGEYFVTLSVFGKGGSGDVTKAITITQDGQGACTGAMEFLTDCATKTWKLNPAEGALWVGPDANSMWWQNSAQDVLDRPCDWNDEFTFSANGVYDYVSNGDFWGEPYSGITPESCQPITALSADRAAWGDGTHAFEIIPGDIPKLKVTGTGAYVGLRKAANGEEVTLPVSEVIYDITRSEIINGKSYLELEINYGVGIWRFTLDSQ
jgi:PKD repeat protein